ncbi:N-acyl homoserine lactonase family protein [Neorhizobium sp. NCHU2750]|uniref:N-acyl homoserine lactonase family protein n=1 Tax=Neorhizobium sp. NCHU2750 TaxID=1825976 RepID=UPI000E768F18|nr:N-acyl homoserine lactone hydrolase [Neorhizobium sp. NCHU2750]
MTFIKRLWALEGGYIRPDRGALVLGEQGPVTIPSPTFLMEHERGLVLMDTGMVPAAADDVHAVYGDMAELDGISLKPEHRVDRQLEMIGFKTSDVDYVIMSHLHWDHTGGMYLFPHAKFFVMSGELQYAFWPRAGGPLYRREDIEPTRGFDWTEIEIPDFDFFGDGSLRVVHLPGHSPGNASLVVRLANRTFILAGDTAHLRSGLEKDLPMPSDWNTFEAVRSIRKLKQMAHSLDARIWMLHDDEDWAEFKHAPDFYA